MFKMYFRNVRRTVNVSKMFLERFTYITISNHFLNICIKKLLIKEE